MAKYPAIQKRAQLEIQNSIGDRTPTSADRQNLKLIEAIICEIFRVSAFVQFAVSRAIRATTLKGYTIPKDSIVFLNMYGLHRDPTIWKDPEHFHLENFFDEATSSLINTEYLIPFSIGIFTK